MDPIPTLAAWRLVPRLQPHCSVAAVQKKRDKRWDEAREGGRPGGAWNAGFRSWHSMLRGRESIEVFNSGRERVRWGKVAGERG